MAGRAARRGAAAPRVLASPAVPARLDPRLAVAAALTAALATGCAAPPRKMSFAEAGLVPPGVAPEPEPAQPEAIEPDGPVLAPVAIPAPEAVATERPEGPAIDPTLVRFAAEARTRRARAPAGGFPHDAAIAWEALLPELDAYLARALPQTPLLELVRARVTVEAEWDYDARRFGAAPAPLAVAVAARVRRLAIRIDAARALGLALFARPAPARLRWPVDDAGISSTFGVRVDPLTGERRRHAGIDLAADKGRVVSAAAAGWVVRAGFTGGYGLLVEVRHAGDVTTRYGHLSAILCAPGDRVDPGQPLGLVGRTGRATGPHLHFEVWRGGAAEDPLAWLGLGAHEGSAGY
jgi:murein DD-endopeptidase MepM/ murein hydrolase activator NlpD